MVQKILFYLDFQFIHFYIAKYFQDQKAFDLFGIIDLNNKPKKFFEEQKIVQFKKCWYLRNGIQNNIEKPDLKYLKLFEEKYDINLWSIIYSERKFYPNFNEYHQFHYDEILSILEKECKFFEKILDEINPNFLFINATDWHHMHLLTQLCKSKKIKVLMLDLAKIGKRCQIEENFEFLNFKTNDHVKNKTLEELQIYLKKDSRTSQAIAETNEFSKLNMKKFRAIFELFFKNDKKYIQHYTNYGKTRLNILYIESKIILKRLFREKFLNKKSISKLPENKKFIFFPLHFEPERVLLIDSPYYTNQLEVITNIAKSLPVDYSLFVKDHPVMKSIGWRKISFYKEIIEMPNVELLNPFIQTEEILKKCSLVITISGTVAIEAAFYNKSSIVLGKFWGHTKLKSVFKVHNIEELPNIIRKVLKKKIDISELNDYVNWIEKNTFEFNHNRYVLDLWNQFYFGGSLVNVDISIKKMMSFLSKYKSELDTVALEHLKKIEQNKIL